MSDEQFQKRIEIVRQHVADLKAQAVEAWEEGASALEGLELIFEEMQTSLEVAERVEEELLQENQRLAEGYQHYYTLFQRAPVAYLVTDVNGVILEANQAAANLLNIPQNYLPGRPLPLYVEESRRQGFRIGLHELTLSIGTQVLPTAFCPRYGHPLPVELYVDAVCNTAGLIEALRMAVYTPALAQLEARGSTPTQAAESAPNNRSAAAGLLPQSLDGLRVLVVDDEVDAREFIAAALEYYGIGVKAVASAAAALEALDQFRPDVLVSDIRMASEDGYSLIQRVRALEAERGGHLPAAAITAYLDEDREKALTAGFEAHLHKLAQPTELVELVVQLAGCGRKS
ncbi:MAG TPA: response regulator [Trichocoleus sp.]